MYPELDNAGGLANAINIVFAKLNSSMRVSIDQNDRKPPFAYARVENGNRFSQITIAAETKLYLTDFWKDGVCLANASTSDISEVARVVDYWLTQSVSTQALYEKFNFVQPTDKAKAFDEGTEVEYSWQCLLLSDDCLDLNEFINLASKKAPLNKLFPFKSLYTLCFSRCTGYPFDKTDLPEVTPIEYIYFTLPKGSIKDDKIEHYKANPNEKAYVVTKNRMQYIGVGNANEALKIVLNNLPYDIKPARKGTADD